jgi:hydroxymethylglutaryl-CoA lyase
MSGLRARIIEVGPRDGLQNESRMLSVAERVDLINRLSAAGLTAIEAGSFVSPKWVPQMAGSADVLEQVHSREGLSLPVLVPNMKGFEDAAAAGAKEIAVFASASETFSQRNINCSTEESLRRFEPVIQAARDAGILVRGYVSCVLGCPYEGAVDTGAVSALAASLHHLGCYEISLGDTIGVGTPYKAVAMTEAVAQQVPMEKLALHFHDTYGQALANIFACFQLGIRTYDASVGGLGGCPYAKGASGNVATEDLVYMFNGMGVETGADLDAIISIARDVSKSLGKPPASRLGRLEKAGTQPVAG